MKWVLAVSMFLGFDVVSVEFATEAECMVAAAIIAEADPTLEWIDRPGVLKGHIRPVIRDTIECVGPEDPLSYEGEYAPQTAGGTG